ncbi:hypothetical protein BGZ54_009147 [Gamsiella multidivaricata]|nr:hypothetical protein BGZ54_009147 [Gamsiella multidivaricata]
MLMSGVGLMISYADRSNVAVGIVAIGREYGYTKPQQGLILASFFFGYILTPIMGGALADRYGGKSVLAIGALAWSVFTLLTPVASGSGLFWIVLVRIALGLGEGVAYPSIHAMIGTWIPPSERSKAVATIWGASDPLSCRWITEHEKYWILEQQQLDQTEQDDAYHHRRSAEDLRDTREQIRTVDNGGSPVTYQSLPAINHSEHNISLRGSEDSQTALQASTSSMQPNSDENDLVYRMDGASAQSSRWQAFRDRIRSGGSDGGLRRAQKKEAVPWRALLARREVWAIILSQLFNSLGYFVMQSWVPTFYLDFYGVDVGKIGYYAVVPSAVQGIMGLLAGYLGDKAIEDWGWATLTVRRASQTVGSIGLGLFLLLAVNFAHTAPLAMILIMVGMALNGFTMIGASAYQVSFSFFHRFCLHIALPVYAHP